MQELRQDKVNRSRVTASMIPDFVHVISMSFQSHQHSFKQNCVSFYTPLDTWFYPAEKCIKER